VWLNGDGVGANHDEIAKADLAGITVSGAKWLVEEKGALAVGTDTSAVEQRPPSEQLDDGTSFNPVHVYLLARQGVHILEYQNLEKLAEDEVYKFAGETQSSKDHRRRGRPGRGRRFRRRSWRP
jgi:kynurenine formamidase